MLSPFGCRILGVTIHDVAVGQNVRNRELGKSAGSCSLNDTYKRNIVRGKLIKLNLKLVHGTGGLAKW